MSELQPAGMPLGLASAGPTSPEPNVAEIQPDGANGKAGRIE